MLTLFIGLAQDTAPRQFDLACTGNAWERPTGGTGSPAQYRFRLDLDANRWCEGECTRIAEIKSVTADRYVLTDEEYRSRTMRTVNSSWIDRVTGKHSEFNLVSGSLVQGSRREAQCEREPFSGMPQSRL
ncbi:hypothetical protein D3C72_1353920 [compost metagenome]